MIQGSEENESFGIFPEATRQLLLVVAPEWGSCQAVLQRYARPGDDAPWQVVGESVPVSLGRCGLAWGRGLHPAQPGARVKGEGDGCAPAGIFAITALFGYAAAESAFARAARLPYLSASSALKCIDDPKSAHYNRIVDQGRVAEIDWHSCEEMLRQDHRYELGAVIAHNSAPPVAGAGSCVFLHVWEAPGLPTAGCTAMSLADMTTLAGWLDGAGAPLLVQLPREEYERLQAAWGLPAF